MSAAELEHCHYYCGIEANFNTRDPSRGRMASVFLVYDSAIVRAGVACLINADSGSVVVGETHDAHSALEQLSRDPAEVVVADANFQGMSVPTLTKSLASLNNPPELLIAPSHGHHHHVEELLRAGVRGFLAANATTSDLFEAIEAVSQRLYYFSEPIAQGLLRGLAGAPRTEGPKIEQLSNREIQTLTLVAGGWSSKEIGHELSLSTRTIETYRHSIMAKLDLRKTADLVRFAIREGLVMP